MKKPQPHNFPWDEVLFQSVYWPGLCVAGLCIGAGVRLLATTAVLGVFGLLIGITLAYLTMEANA